MQTKRQLKRCTRNVHPSFADFRPGLGVNFLILLTQNWLWESSLSLLSLWCILFQTKLGLFRENLNLKKHLGPKNGWSSPSTFWHRLIYIILIHFLPLKSRKGLACDIFDTFCHTCWPCLIRSLITKGQHSWSCFHNFQTLIFIEQNEKSSEKQLCVCVFPIPFFWWSCYFCLMTSIQ